MSPVIPHNTTHSNAKTSKTSGARIYVEIADDIRRQVKDRSLGYDSSFPSHRQLASVFRVSLSTIQRAIRILVAEGILTAKPDQGVFVTNQLLSPPAALKNVSRTTQATNLRGRTTPDFQLGRIAIVTAQRLEPLDDEPKHLSHQDILLHALEHSISADFGVSAVHSISQLPGETATFRSMVLRLSDEGYDGIIVVPDYSAEYLGAVEEITYSGVPIVVIAAHEIDSTLPYVYHDNRDSGRLAAQHLLSQGCRSMLAFSPYRAAWVDQRVIGAVGRANGSIEVRVQDEEVPLHPIFKCNGLRRAAYEYAREVITSNAAFDGVIGLNDAFALGFRDAAEQVGLIAGEDFALIGFDDNVSARHNGLTTLRPPATRSGEEAVRLLHRLILDNPEAGRAPAPMRICLHSDLVLRESSLLRRPVASAERRIVEF